ncbi:uncharacterized protein EHS24_000692 [Apiotrichum porosum]|uniref:Ubiquitin-like domain-containing protein n=1 Tax=Apiotrichum porosum TaxID=105984 RepID=A0A427YAY4_9TREE|nr:uncharacterized protein EHS24_000692 [Apiotrichum porosum]RSH88164.1 hypothetical protein EHS24_000692 [Apiotrichum porosum]
MSDAGSPSANDEVKPKADENTLNIKIRATDGSEVFFKIKKTTKLNKLKNAYAGRVGQDPSAIRYVKPEHWDGRDASGDGAGPHPTDAVPAPLLFDGQRIVDNQTAEDLEMEDGDVIEVLLEQVGGFF